MKTMIALLSLVISANVFAYSVADSTVLASASPMLSSATTSGTLPDKQAALILNDAQDLIQDGKMSSFLNQKIKEVQALHIETSESEALDLLISQAESILK
ncbi:MAG: hypothetical protein H7336_11980 [Bacteriovorax sp.]|nr:hypothetical protein [Bacteriovorax sp.]